MTDTEPTAVASQASELGERMDGSGTLAITRERYRQQVAEGYTMDHDQLHEDGELIMAALVYLRAAQAVERGVLTSPKGKIADELIADGAWPFREPAKIETGHTGYERMLVKAGALIAAELDRLSYTRAARQMGAT
jgi:hypothetical protein